MLTLFFTLLNAISDNALNPPDCFLYEIFIISFPIVYTLPLGNWLGNCNDIEVLQEVSKANSGKILDIINKITPKGKTPISQSLKQAAETLQYTEDSATIILISDGVNWTYIF